RWIARAHDPDGNRLALLRRAAARRARVHRLDRGRHVLRHEWVPDWQAHPREVAPCKLLHGLLRAAVLPNYPSLRGHRRFGQRIAWSYLQALDGRRSSIPPVVVSDLRA